MSCKSVATRTVEETVVDQPRSALIRWIASKICFITENSANGNTLPRRCALKLKRSWRSPLFCVVARLLYVVLAWLCGERGCFICRESHVCFPAKSHDKHKHPGLLSKCLREQLNSEQSVIIAASLTAKCLWCGKGNKRRRWTVALVLMVAGECQIYIIQRRSVGISRLVDVIMSLPPVTLL